MRPPCNPSVSAVACTPATPGRLLADMATLVLILIAITGCADREQTLKVSDGWVRLSPPNSMMTAGYGTLTNMSKEALTLKSFSSPQYSEVTLHYTEEVNGTATMREARNYRLTPGETLELSPGGYHLMLMQRKMPTPEGSSVNVKIELKSGTTTAHLFTVTRR